MAVAVVVVAVLGSVLAWAQWGDTRRSYRNRCEYNLCYIYVVWNHVPQALAALPPEKRVAFSFCTGCERWTPSEQELGYLRDHGFWSPDRVGWNSPDIIYCFEDPLFRDRVSSVTQMSVYTAAADLAPSSYVWLPEDDPGILAACPYHHIAVRQDTGEIIPWRAKRD